MALKSGRVGIHPSQVDPITGMLLVSPSGASSMADLSDAQITDPAAGQTLIYNGEKWENEFSSISPTTLATLQDVSITDPSDGDYLIYNSTEDKWINSGSTPGPVVPEGSTVTPTDDIQKWLACAGITDKTYTTLAEVLNDSTTLLALLSNNNASDYLVRSKSWATASGLVPTMTSNTTPSGVVTCSSSYDSSGYESFNPSIGDYWKTQTNGANEWLAYEFPTATVCKYLKYTYKLSANDTRSVRNIKIQAYNSNSSSWVDLASATISNATTNNTQTIDLNNSTAYTKYRMLVVDNYGYTNRTISGVLQFYQITEGLCDNSTAMTDIGANDYCAETLLADSTWCNAICNSTYFESVLTTKVPTMTSNTTPSGECLYDSESYNRYAYYAFNGDWTKSAGSTGAINTYTMWASNKGDPSTEASLGYDFGTPKKIYAIRYRGAGYGGSDNAPIIYTFKVQYSDDSTTWTDDAIGTITPTLDFNTQVFPIKTTTAHRYWRIVPLTGLASYSYCVSNLQFYGR